MNKEPTKYPHAKEVWGVIWFLLLIGAWITVFKLGMC